MTRLYEPCALVVVKENQPEHVRLWLSNLEWGQEEPEVLCTTFLGEDPETLVRVTLPTNSECEIVTKGQEAILTSVFTFGHTQREKFLDNGGRCLVFSLENGEKVYFAQGVDLKQCRIAFVDPPQGA